MFNCAIYPAPSDFVTLSPKKSHLAHKNFLRVYQHLPKKQVPLWIADCGLSIVDCRLQIAD